MDILHTDNILFSVGFLHLCSSLFSYCVGFIVADCSALSGIILLQFMLLS